MKKTIIILLFVSILIVSQLIPFLNYNVDNKKFMGIPYSVVDTNNYFSYMQQAKEGNLAFTNKFTAEKVPFIFFQPVFLPMGWLTLILPEVFVYYLFKFIFIIIFAILVYKLLELIVDKKELNISAIFVLFGSGIGYVFLLLNNLGVKLYGSVDYWLSASNSIGLNLAPVHFAISVCLMIAIVILYYKFWEEKKISYLITLSILTLILGFTHLFDVISLIPAFGVYMIWRLVNKKDNIHTILKYNLIYAAIAIIPFIYTYYIFAVNPLFKEWDAQNVLETPKLLHVLFGYFIPFSFAIYYLKHKLINKIKFEDLEVILFVWMFSSMFLLYSPLNIQRRFIEGLNIPIMILGSLGFLRVFLPLIQKKFTKSIKPVAILLMILLITPTSFHWLYKINANINPNIEVGDYSIPYYLDKDEIEALNWLKDNTNSDKTIISGYGIGNYIPRMTGNRAFLAHWAQTINLEKKKSDVKQFFSSNDVSFNKDLIKQYEIDYVYYGIEEQKLGVFEPKDMKKVFENSKVVVYQVKWEQ